MSSVLVGEAAAAVAAAVEMEPAFANRDTTTLEVQIRRVVSTIIRSLFTIGFVIELSLVVFFVLLYLAVVVVVVVQGEVILDIGFTERMGLLGEELTETEPGAIDDW